MSVSVTLALQSVWNPQLIDQFSLSVSVESIMKSWSGKFAKEGGNIIWQHLNSLQPIMSPLMRGVSFTQKLCGLYS